MENQENKEINKTEKVEKNEQVQKTEEVVKIEEGKTTKQKTKKVKPVEPTYEYATEDLAEIEKARKDFFTKFNSSNMAKWIIAAIAIAVVIFAWVGLSNLKDAEGKQLSFVLPLQLSLLGLVIVGAFTYTAISSKSMHKKMKAYFDVYYSNVNKYIFKDDCYTDVIQQENAGISRETFMAPNLYEKADHVSSRNVVNFKYEGMDLTSVDCAGQIYPEKGKNAVPIFVGKYVSVDLPNFKGDPIYLYYKGDKRSLPPTNMKNEKSVEDNETYIIWSTNVKWNKVINSTAKKILNSIEVGKDLVDFAISIKDGKCAVYLGYDDTLMVVPLKHAFNPRPVYQAETDMKKICEFFKEIRK